MRVKIPARDLKVGHVAFLPYFGALRRARVTTIFSSRTREHVVVRYHVLLEDAPRTENECTTSVDRLYEVYLRPVRTRQKG